MIQKEERQTSTCTYGNHFLKVIVGVYIIRVMQTAQPSSLVVINGVVERVLYSDETAQYAVVRVAEEQTGRLLTAVGSFAGLNAGERIQIEGRWEEHRRFGEQFRAVRYQVLAPISVRGIERYLGSGMIEGIGPVLARRLVKAFGRDTLDVIERQPERLLEVEGIGPKKRRHILEAFNRQKGLREVMVFLQGHGVSAALAGRIFRKYGPGAVGVVRSNPYRLASDVEGIGFKTADRIASEIGIEEASPERAKAGVLYTLQQLAAEGHTCCPLQVLQKESAQTLGIDPRVVEGVIPELAQAGQVVIERQWRDEPVYLAAFQAAEKGAAEALARLARFRPQREIEGGEVCADADLHLTERQMDAVRAAVKSRVCIITGGPGVGKTTVVRCIVPIFQKKGLRVALACPTGRAAKRLSEATGEPASTIHRLLAYDPSRHRFVHDENRPLPQEVVIVDEASMLDIELAHSLLRALRQSSSLILVGDADQLPSVGPGDVLRSLVQCGRFPVVRLDQIFRQAQDSLIIHNAHRINRGEFPVLRKKDASEQDFYFIERGTPEDVLQMVLDLCGRRLPNRFRFDPVRDIQVITPMHRGAVGVENLNVELRRQLNPSAVEAVRGRVALSPGDKVMQVRNNYDKEVYNGDIGVVHSVNRIDGYVTIRYEDRDVRYVMEELDELVLAYAISVHKSQGSEYPAVVLPLVPQHYVMLQRNLLYTAVTRAKRLLVVVGSRRALGAAVRNDRMRQRYSYLKERLQALLPQQSS